MIIAKPDIVIKDFNQNEDFFLMGCDGIWEINDASQLCKIIRDSKKNLSETAEDLLNKALA